MTVDCSAERPKIALWRRLPLPLPRMESAPFVPSGIRAGTARGENADRKRATTDRGQPHGERPIEHLDRVWPDAGPTGIVQ